MSKKQRQTHQILRWIRAHEKRDRQKLRARIKRINETIQGKDLRLQFNMKGLQMLAFANRKERRAEREDAVVAMAIAMAAQVRGEVKVVHK